MLSTITLLSITRHLFRYIDEHAFRYNNRKDMNDADRFSLALSQIIGKGDRFRTPVYDKESPIIEELEEGGLDCHSYLWTVTTMLPFVRMSSTVTSSMLFRTTKSISASPTGRFSTRITSSESGKKGELSWTAFSLNRISIPRLASSIRFTAPAAQD